MSTLPDDANLERNHSAMTSGTDRTQPDTAARILDSAERLVQIAGFNGFSYADVAAELQLTKASLHYHFPGKAELGEALIKRYATRFMDALAEIETGSSGARAKLEAYAELYANVLRDQRTCLCGMLAAEFRTLPAGMQEAVLRFFDENERWLTHVLEQGAAEGTVTFEGAPCDAARMIVGGLEGAMLVARPYGDVERFRTAARQMLVSLTGPAAAR